MPCSTWSRRRRSALTRPTCGPSKRRAWPGHSRPRGTRSRSRAERREQSHRSDLNRRPLDYESRALPLSYGGEDAPKLSELLLDTVLRARRETVAPLGNLAFATLPPPSLDAFSYDQRQHRQRGYRIRPPPAEHRIQPQTEQSRRREPRADDCLVRVGPQCPAPETGRHAE